MLTQFTKAYTGVSLGGNGLMPSKVFSKELGHQYLTICLKCLQISQDHISHLMHYFQIYISIKNLQIQDKSVYIQLIPFGSTDDAFHMDGFIKKMFVFQLIITNAPWILMIMNAPWCHGNPPLFLCSLPPWDVNSFTTGWRALMKIIFLELEYT